MKYKFVYKDSTGNKHHRYYHALNVNTATEMFKATVDHSFGDTDITILNVYRLDTETGNWVERNLHLTNTDVILSLK